MPFFSSATPFDADVEKATNEMNTTEDWSVILDICDQVKTNPSGAKDCLKSICKRLNHRVPHVSMQALTLLDACVNNAGPKFHLEIASRDFVNECKSIISKSHPKVSLKLKQLVKKWAENEFKSDPSLSLIPNLYATLKSEGYDFSDNEPQPKQKTFSKNPDVVDSQQEEDDIAKAIALSLQENDKGSSKTMPTSSLYPSFASMPAPKQKELRKVRALYDFEAAEDNELTFKAGDIISILDDQDPNWWKGNSHRGEGLFPANFVTADLTVEPETKTKSVKFSEEVEVKTMEFVPEMVEIDEEKIDRVLNMIQNADPTGELNPDPADMVLLEEQCKAMNPLIDAELEKIDRKHASLMQQNSEVMAALQMYHDLMKEVPYSYSTLPKPGHYSLPTGSVPQMYNGQMGPVPSYMPPMGPGQVPMMMPPQGQGQMPVQGQMAPQMPGQMPPQDQSMHMQGHGQMMMPGQMPVHQGQPQMPPQQSFSPPHTSSNEDSAPMVPPQQDYTQTTSAAYQGQQQTQDSSNVQTNFATPPQTMPDYSMYGQAPVMSGPPSFVQAAPPQQQPLL